MVEFVPFAAVWKASPAGGSADAFTKAGIIVCEPVFDFFFCEAFFVFQAEQRMLVSFHAGAVKHEIVVDGKYVVHIPDDIYVTVLVEHEADLFTFFELERKLD